MDQTRIIGGRAAAPIGSMELSIDSAQAGKVIGPGGSSVARIRAWSGASVTMESQFDTENKCSRNVRTIKVVGTEAQARSASALLKEVSRGAARVAEDFSLARIEQRGAVTDKLPSAAATDPSSDEGGAWTSVARSKKKGSRHPLDVWHAAK